MLPQETQVSINVEYRKKHGGETTKHEAKMTENAKHAKYEKTHSVVNLGCGLFTCPPGTLRMESLRGLPGFSPQACCDVLSYKKLAVRADRRILQISRNVPNLKPQEFGRDNPISPNFRTENYGQ